MVTNEEKLALDIKLIEAAPLLLESLMNVMNIINNSYGVYGLYSCVDIAKWDEFEEIRQAITAIKKATE